VGSGVGEVGAGGGRRGRGKRETREKGGGEAEGAHSHTLRGPTPPGSFSYRKTSITHFFHLEANLTYYYNWEQGLQVTRQLPVGPRPA
jgi:hypothetical protein